MMLMRLVVLSSLRGRGANCNFRAMQAQVGSNIYIIIGPFSFQGV